MCAQGPTFTADTVLGRDGFLVGAEAAYNVTEGNVTRYAAAVGYNAPEYAVTIHGLNNFKTFTASYYHRVSSDVEAGAKAVYDSKNTHGGVALEVGTKALVHSSCNVFLCVDGSFRYLDNAAFIKAKINNAGVVALGWLSRSVFLAAAHFTRIHSIIAPWCQGIFRPCPRHNKAERCCCYWWPLAQGKILIFFYRILINRVDFPLAWGQLGLRFMNWMDNQGESSYSLILMTICAITTSLVMEGKKKLKTCDVIDSTLYIYIKLYTSYVNPT